jgi:ornithine--oxo-acid transaminase
LCAKSAFHGLTAGALSLMSDAFWREGFGPLLADAAVVPFGDLTALEKQLNSKKFAAFVVEPVQSEAGSKCRRLDIWTVRRRFVGRPGRFLC